MRFNYDCASKSLSHSNSNQASFHEPLRNREVARGTKKKN